MRDFASLGEIVFVSLKRLRIAYLLCPDDVNGVPCTLFFIFVCSWMDICESKHPVGFFTFRGQVKCVSMSDHRTNSLG